MSGQRDRQPLGFDRQARLLSLTGSPVDRALKIGIANEIALMHGTGDGDAEITHKIGTRAVWLLGRDPEDREGVFNEIKKLYDARSQAVDTGTLTAHSKTALQAADALVMRALSTILERGTFPNWSSRTIGGEGFGATA